MEGSKKIERKKKLEGRKVIKEGSRKRKKNEEGKGAKK